MKCLAVCLALIGVVSSPAHTVASAKAPAQASAPAPDVRGSASAPLVVELIESAAHVRENEEASANLKREATRDTWLVVFAGLAVLVAGAQALLFLRQLRLMKDTLVDTRAAAEAAQATGEGNRLAQRAWVACLGPRAEIGRHIIEVKAPGEEEVHPWGVGVYLDWTNVGYTPALQLSMWMACRVFRAPYDQELPPPAPPPPPPGGLTQLAPRMPPVHSSAYYILPADIALLAQEQCRVFLFGGVEYATLFQPDDRRRTLVCFEALFGGYLYNDEDKPRLQFRVIGPHNTAT